MSNIPNPILYNQTESQIANDLLPPPRRQPLWLAWLGALLQSTQYDHDLIFNDYANGSPAANWVSGTAYTYLTRVIDVDGAVYELQNTAGLTSATHPNQDSANWIRVLDTWIGVRERARYTGQKVMLEYVLNKFFQISIALPESGELFQGSTVWVSGIYYVPSNKVSFTDGNLYICILATTSAFENPTHTANWSALANIFITDDLNSNSNFWLSDDGIGGLTSYMANGSKSQHFYLGTAYTYNPISFVIHLPNGLFSAIGANVPVNLPPGITTNIEAARAIKAVADKYVQAGYFYTIQTFPSPLSPPLQFPLP